MNTETKTEWRLVPVEPTDEMYDDCDNQRLAQLYWRKLINAAPTPQASEPVAITEAGRYGTRLTWCSEEAQTNTPAGVLLYDHATPCERCVELEAMESVSLVVKQMKRIAALEAENARLTNAESPLLQTMEVNAWRAVVTGLCLRFPNSPEDAREQIKGRMQEQDKARKQAQADLETYKGRCTDLEHQNERLNGENARLAEESVAFACNLRGKHATTGATYQHLQNTIAQQAEQLAAVKTMAQAVIDRWDTPLWKDAPATATFIYALRDTIAAQKEGK